MVQVIENRADIEARVLAIKPDTSRPEHRLVTVEVGSTQAVEGYPNLFAKTPGSQIDLIVPAEAATPLKVGAAVRCRIRRGGPNAVFAEQCKPQ
jgi:hypothetical protein